MCTVTYIPFDSDNFILTSSRDVPFSREKASPPGGYTEEGVEMIYPRDGRAGGTWIGTSDKKRLICLLNGGFENHRQKGNYARSRGLIVKDLLKADDISLACREIGLLNIEPFTLVIVEWDLHLFLFEFVWDGVQKHLRILPQEPCIWSSSTLYSDKMKEMRKDWFKDWQERIKLQDSDFKTVKKNILNFHHTAGTGEPEVDVLMKRSKVGTVSITSVQKTEDRIEWDYEAVDQSE